MIVPLSYHDSFIKPVLTKAVSEAASSCCQFVPVKSFLVGNDCIWEHASGCCWDINQVVTFCFARSAQTQPARLLSQVCLALQWQAAQCTMPLAISKQADQAVAWWFVSHFFASCASPKTTQTCKNSTRFACYSLMSVWFWTVQHAKQCNKIWYLGPLPQADWLLLQQTANALSFHTGGSC